MSTVNVSKECGCFKKSELTNNVTFENKDDAMIEAQRMIKHMNEEFCGKHSFELSENGNDLSISMKEPQAANAGGCCGGGDC